MASNDGWFGEAASSASVRWFCCGWQNVRDAVRQPKVRFVNPSGAEST
jgi:hypothetical protein